MKNSNNSNEEMYLSMGISKTVYDYGCAIEKSLRERFDEVDRNAEYNQLKVVKAMQQHQVSEACLLGTTGYGYNDLGRDTLEAVYAATFHTEDALVRPQITCGTHALALALMSNLRPGDELLSPVGKPYDTLEEVIGIRPSKGSLAEYGVTYRQVDLLPDGSFDYDKIRENINEKTHLVTIQRSKGYQTRPTLSVQRIGELIAFIKGIKPDVICMVDNCYGEFVDTIEPSDVGADMIVGSLIKNPGGGLAPIGGYIAGTKECVENASYRMTCPGLGSEVGATLGVNRSFFQGFFLAPMVTKGALKGAVFAANIYEKLGFPVIPDSTNVAHMGISHPSQRGHRPSAAGAAVTVNIEGGTLIGHHRPDPGHLLQGQILTAGNVAVGVLLPGPHIQQNSLGVRLVLCQAGIDVRLKEKIQKSHVWSPFSGVCLFGWCYLTTFFRHEL